MREGGVRADARLHTIVNSTRNTISEASHENTVHSNNLSSPPERSNSNIITPSTEGDAGTTSKEPDGVDEVAKTNLNGRVKLSIVTPPSQDVLAEVSHVQFDSGVDVGESSNTENNILEGHVMPPNAAQPPLTQALKAPGGSLGISSKGKAPARPPETKPAHIHIPRSRLERLRKIRVANPEIIKVEDAEFSPANREKLRNFSRVVSSKKDQIELFGKELPLCRASLVQVTEGSANPMDCICVQGLRNSTDITRFHTAMSHKRYKPIYDPLKLCYDTSDLSHVGYRGGSASNSSRHWPEPKTRFMNPTLEQGEMVETMHAFYQYRPVAEDKTYCGALSRTHIHGNPWISTLGGIVEVENMTYLMSCQHDTADTTVSSGPSLADTLVEDDIPSNVEGPLVFSTKVLPDSFDAINSPEGHSGCDDPGSLEGPQTIDELAFSDPEAKAGWKNLPVARAIRKGREWCLIPVEERSMLPNFVERTRTKKGKDIGDPEIRYIEEISEPRAGCTGYVATGSGGYSGTFSKNITFIVGGGTEGLVEAWTILFDETQGNPPKSHSDEMYSANTLKERFQKGGSGSWVLDTSNPLRYTAVGATIAASSGAVHFVRLSDQFHEINGVLDGRSHISLPSTFRTLVQCAHLSFKANNPSSYWFLDQALSPHALQQMSNGWYLPAIKSMLGVENGDTMSEESTKLPDIHALHACRGLLLRYGAYLLDNIIHGEEWLSFHSYQLSSSEIDVLRGLFAIARPFRESEMYHRKKNSFLIREELSGIHSDENGEESQSIYIYI